MNDYDYCVFHASRVTAGVRNLREQRNYFTMGAPPVLIFDTPRRNLASSTH